MNIERNGVTDHGGLYCKGYWEEERTWQEQWGLEYRTLKS